MIQTILQTVVTTVGVAMITTQPAPTVAPVQVITERTHVVAAGESLSQIAYDSYNNKDAWTVILKDNPQVKNPNVLEKGTTLKVRIATPSASEVAALKPAVTQYEGTMPMHDSIVLEATPSVAPQTAAAVYTGGPLSEEQITFLGTCEAGMDPQKNTGNGYYGAFQFSYGTWKSMETGYERADMAPLEVQKAAVQKLLSRSSIFHQFPGCAKKMRSLGMI